MSLSLTLPPPSQPELKTLDGDAMDPTASTNSFGHKHVALQPRPMPRHDTDDDLMMMAEDTEQPDGEHDRNSVDCDEIETSLSNGHVEVQDDGAEYEADKAMDSHEPKTVSPQTTFKTGATRSLLHRLFEKRDELQQSRTTSTSFVRAPVRSFSCGALDSNSTPSPNPQSVGSRLAPYLCGLFDQVGVSNKVSDSPEKKEFADGKAETVQCDYYQGMGGLRGLCAHALDSGENETVDAPLALPKPPNNEALEAQQRHFQNYVAGLEALGSPMHGEELLLAPFDALHPEEGDDSSSSDDEDDVARHRQWQDRNNTKRSLPRSGSTIGKNFLRPYASFPLNSLCQRGPRDFEVRLDEVWDENSLCGGDKSSVPQRLPTASTLTSVEESCSFMLGGPDDGTATPVEGNGNADKVATVPDFPPLQVFPESADILETCPRLLTPSMMVELWEELPPPQRLRTWVRAYSTVRDGDHFHTMLRLCAFYEQSIVVIRTSSGDILGGYADRPWGHSKDTVILSPTRSSSSLDLQSLPVSPSSYPGRFGACSPKSVFYGTGQSFLFASNPAEEEEEEEEDQDASHSPSPSFQGEEPLDSSNGANSTKQLYIYHWTGQNSFSQKFDLDGGGHLAMGGGSDFGFIIQDNFSTGRTGHSDTFGNPPLTKNNVDGRIDIVDCEVYGFRQGVL